MRPFSNKGYIDDEIIALAFDTETVGLGGELLCITAYDFDKPHLFEGDNKIYDFFNLVFQFPSPFVWFAHNAQYDLRYMMNYIKDNGIDCIINMRDETNIYQITLIKDKEKFILRDSMALFPGTLKQFADCFTPELPKEDIDFSGGELFDLSNSAHRHYAIRDVEILRKGLPRFNAMLNRHFGISMGHTTAGTALKAWQSSIPDGVYYDPSKFGDEEAFIRDGYYGGLVFLTRTDLLHDVETYDINSSYPSQMKYKGVPSGQSSRSTDWQHKNGIFHVRIQTPSDLIVPIIPRRNERGHMFWSRGEFNTTVTSMELRFAVEHGYRVIECIEGIAWEQIIFPFTTFVDRCRSIRKQYKGGPEETLAKLMQNSLYGKYGSRRDRLQVFIPEKDDDRLDAVPLDEDGYWWIKREFSDDLRCLPQWAVWITANARLQLLATIYNVGVENVIYGDTDSITVLKGHASRIDVGNEYGQFKLEKTWKSFRALAPKVYSGILDNGKFKGAAKGLPRRKMTQVHWEALLNDERIAIAYDTLDSLKVAMRKGIEPARHVSRLSTDINNSTGWQVVNQRVQPKEFYHEY